MSILSCNPPANFAPSIEIKEDKDHWRNLFRYLQLPAAENEELIEKLCNGFPYLAEEAESTRFSKLIPVGVNDREIRFGVYFTTMGYVGFKNKRSDWTYVNASLTATVVDRVLQKGSLQGGIPRKVLPAVILVSESMDIESVADAEKFLNHCWLKWNFLKLVLDKIDDPKQAKS